MARRYNGPQPQGQALPQDAENTDNRPGVFEVRPDPFTRNSFMIGVAIAGYFAITWADDVRNDSTEAKAQSDRALQMIEQLSRQVNAMPDRLEEAITNAVAPLQQRVEDVRSQLNETYSVNAAQRDKAQTEQVISQMRTEINTNQNSIQTTSGRVESIESNIKDMQAKLDQIYQAVLSNNKSTTHAMRYPVYELPESSSTPFSF